MEKYVYENTLCKRFLNLLLLSRLNRPPAGIYGYRWGRGLYCKSAVQRITWIFITLFQVLSSLAWAGQEKPVYIGLDAEFGLAGSTSAQAIELGIRVAIDEINRAGGVLGGRPLALKITDNRSVTARGIKNLEKLAKVPDLVAVFEGRFSPVVLECIDKAHQLEMILLAPWSAADAITENGRYPNYVFRLSLRDKFAISTMFRYARKKGAQRVGLLLPNTSWGRSNQTAVQGYSKHYLLPSVVATAWYNWGDPSMINKYLTLWQAGAEAIIFVANDVEAAILIPEVARLPEQQRLPIISHWGVTGGRFVELVDDALDKVDFSMIQTFSFYKADKARVDRFMTGAGRLFGLSRIEQIKSPVGVGHAYDLTHILARAIDLAGTTDRPAIRDALEQVKNYQGLVKNFKQPFSPTRHDALGADAVFMARYRSDGSIMPLE